MIRYGGTVLIPSSRRDDNILLPIPSRVRGRYRVRARGKLRHPQFPARIFVECAESRIVRGPDKHEPASGDDAAAEIYCSGLGNPLRRQLIVDPENAAN